MPSLELARDREITPEEAEKRILGPGGSVARAWHEGAVVRRARGERISKNILEQQEMRADDRNRTRMTSLEGSGYGGSDQRLRRSAAFPPARE